MFFIAKETTVLILALFNCLSGDHLNAPKGQHVSDILEVAYDIREEANKIRGEALEMMNRALSMKEEAVDQREKYYSKSEMERSLLETLCDIKNSLAGVSVRMEKLEDKVGMLEQKIDSQKDTLEEMQEDLGAVKRRQQHVISEVRLISLYKMSDQTSFDGNYRDSDLIVDGQFMFDKNVIESMQAYTKTDGNANNKLKIHLGGLFRIHRVKVWNVRFCCQERFIGTRILADDRIIGVAVSAKPIYKFDVHERDPAYARVITLHQELAQNLHVLEVQVWGSGPYAEDDLFA